tara:strand:- start:603 stop:1877 length:1275 start_codon:yes stop_codon:yes gene_type:complete
MKSFLDKIFLRSNNLDSVSQNIKKFTQKTPTKKIFESINSYSLESEVRYVGGFVRKIINQENVDDIDLATNLEPDQVCEALKKDDINFYKSGIDHGTITAVIDKYKFEITSLRKDILTDGRHAKIKFSKDWKEDASRRDFTINSIYSDSEGNLFDPFNGKEDLEKGIISFIGHTDKRIKEDYLRILRYLRFFLNYSKQPHNKEIIRYLKMNIEGISKLSKDRLLDELKKIIKINTLEKLANDKVSLDLILIIFPELKNIKVFSKLNSKNKTLLKEKDFIFLLSLIIVDDSDNVDYFLYKFNISKKDQKRIKNIDNFFKNKINSKTFTQNNMNKVFYYLGKETTLEIINYRTIKSNKVDNALDELRKYYQNKEDLVMPVSADFLIKKYRIPESKELGEKLKKIEEEWVNNNFEISEQKIDFIVNS